MPGKLLVKSVGPWPMNVYLVVCEDTLASAIIDPGADAEDVLALAEGTRVERILLTHAHPDHVGALAKVKAATGAPVYLHPNEAVKFGIAYDVPLDEGPSGGPLIPVGNYKIRAIFTPGHTPGMVCYSLGGDPGQVDDPRVVVGDTLFVGGPGHTDSPEDFAVTMTTMQQVVFTWPDGTRFFPGHGPSGTIGEERPAFEAFVSRGWSPELCGDVTWIGD